MQKPGIPSGTRDFNPGTVLKRKFILQNIEEVFRLFGFVPIETPSMENLSTLSGKYGEEGDQLLYKVLNSGDFLSKADHQAIQNGDYKKTAISIAEKGLRYDLTIPFARYVVMHRNDISFPFKRYQIQPVWRADRPQKGRYREFWQCDADIIGSDHLVNEADLVKIYASAFRKLNLPVLIRYNNRKFLDGLCAHFFISNHVSEFLTILDKADKIGMDGVRKLLEEKSWSGNAQQALDVLIELSTQATNTDKLAVVGKVLGEEHAGYTELKLLHSLLENGGIGNAGFDPFLARGLNYYTGTVFEVVPDLGNEISVGSIGGGGRYDDLTGIFGMPGVSGVGISFGLDRIYDIMELAGLFPEMQIPGPKVIICCMDEDSIPYCVSMLDQLRNEGISSDLYPGAPKLKKQLDYANARQTPWAIIVGSRERESGHAVLKDLISGNQHELSTEAIISQLKS